MEVFFMDRVIGKYKGKHPRVMLIAIGGIHGNEPAGVLAITEVLEILQNTPEKLNYQGIMLGLRGNCAALSNQRRFMDKDLNRIWNPEYITHLDNIPKHGWCSEDNEMMALRAAILYEIINERPQQVILLDIHTTSGEGSVFSVVPEDKRSLILANHIGAPIVKGIANGVGNTLLQYFNTQQLDTIITVIAFEAGQHQDIDAINSAKQAILKLLAQPMEFDEKQIEQINYGSLYDISYCHKILPDDEFEMASGFHNFQSVAKGTILASDKYGNISAPYDCKMLMPLYQKQGEEGFFLIKNTYF